MADSPDKLGTLEYDMLVNQKLLDKQLDEITKKLQEKDKQWKEILSGQGTVASPKINVADLNNVTKANEAIAQSTVAIKSSIEKLKTELSENVKAYEALSRAKRADVEVGGKLLTTINTQKDQLNEYNKTLRANIQARKDAAKAAADQAKLEQTAKVSLESQRSKAFVKSNLDEEKQLTAELKKQESALRSLEAQRSKAYVSGNIQKEKELTAEIKAQQSAMRALEAQRSKAYVATQTKALREEQLALRANWQEQKLKMAVDAQAVGSIERLRAQYALLKFQLTQVKFTDPNAVANVQQLQASIRGVKSEITDLQPTLGFWGKLTSAIKTYATAYLSVQAVMGLGRAVYMQTKDLDSLNFSMKTVIKSSTELAQTQKFLSDVAINYGGDLLTMSERYIKFRAAALQSNMTASDTQKIFDSVSKAAGTLGLKTDELSGVYLALEQMISKGKVSTEELRRQLGERLPGAFGIMANALGVTIPQLDKLLKKGQILSADALPKFAIALEKAYGIEALTKIDTLAAAQGRLSTQFTGLIKSLGASDAFKNTINNIAGAIGFLKDYMDVIITTGKVLLTLAIAQGAWKASIILSIPIQKAMLILTKEQTTLLPLLSAQQLAAATTATAAAAGTTMWARAWNALKIAFVSNPLGAILTAITLIGTAFYLLIDDTKKAKNEVTGFADNMAAQTAKLELVFNSLRTATKGSNEFKDAMFQINNMLTNGGFLDNLLTENNYLTEQSKAYKLLNEAIFDQILLKEQQAELEKSIAKYSEVVKKTQQEISTKPVNVDEYVSFGGLVSKQYKKEGADFGMFELSGDQQNKILMQVKDTAEKGLKSTKETLDDLKTGALKTVTEIIEGSKGLTKEQKDNLTSFYTNKLVSLTTDLRKAGDINRAEMKMAAELYSVTKKKVSDIFDPKDLADAKDEFDKFSGLIGDETKKQFVVDSKYVQSGVDTYKAYLLRLLDEFKNNQTARVAIENEISSIKEKKDPTIKLDEKRNEALKRLNDKYLADQEEFANFDLGIAAGRIAAMEDGIEKEKKLNELAYENRIAAINKEKQQRLDIINEIEGRKKGSPNEILDFNATGLSKEGQAKADEGLKNDTQYRINAKKVLDEANINSEKDYQYKIAELRRDANDQFLSGLEKERAAIDEKYDDWMRKAAAANDITLMADIGINQKIAQSELNKQYELDQLDFVREIEYKKNEIRLSGSAQSMKLEKANFDVYVKYERERIKILKSSTSIDKQKEGINKEAALAVDEKLFNIKQEKELEQKILDGAKQISEEYIKQAGLTGESAENLQLAVSTLQSIAKGDYLSAALGVVSKILTSFKNFSSDESEMVAYFEQLQAKISAIVDKISLLNNTLAKMGSSASVMGVQLLQSEMLNLANDAARLNEQLKIIADNEGRRGVGNTNAGTSTGGNRTEASDATEARKRIVVDLIKQTEYLNQQIILLSSKLLNPNLTEEQRKAVEAVLQGYIDIVDAIDSSIQSITGTSINELSNAIVDAFLAGENAAEAWGVKVNDIIKYMVKQQLIAQLLTKPITQAIQTLVGDSADGITPDEALKFKDTIKGITEDVAPAIAAASEAMKQVGIDLTTGAASSSAAGISKGIQALTEDTGRRLEGLINSIRESGVINMGNTKQLVESSQMIQGYAAQSLSELRMVNTNLATQIGIFNDWSTTTNGTGGKGIKVYVQ